MKEKILVIYHDVDFDGKCSAAIVAHAFDYVDFYGWSHYRDINWELIEQYGTIIMVDISFPTVDDMKRLEFVADKFIWIDHHVTSIDKYKDLGFNGIYEVGKGACQLCWEYFYPDVEIPKVVKLLADYDIWDHSNEDTLPFQYGMRYFNIDVDHNPTWYLLFSNYKEKFDNILNSGKICFNFETTLNKYRAKNSFEVEFEGYNCIALNAGGGSLVLESVNGRNYDIMILFTFNGEYCNVSMYNDNGKVNVGEIAKKYGGGGHKGAAGFKSDKLLFYKK